MPVIKEKDRALQGWHSLQMHRITGCSYFIFGKILPVCNLFWI